MLEEAIALEALKEISINRSVDRSVGGWYHSVKDIIDWLSSAILMVVALPVMLICALLVKLSDPKGAVVYSQVRVGLNGQLFVVYKLRTMYVDAEAHGKAVWAGKNDPRVIPACRWMRRSHVDELPQLWNILRGEMSLIGPRPERPELFLKLMKEVPSFEQRLLVKPGITGLAQVKNGYDICVDSVRRKLEYDLEYIKKMSFGQDIKILLATFSKFRDTESR